MTTISVTRRACVSFARAPEAVHRNLSMDNRKQLTFVFSLCSCNS